MNQWDANTYDNRGFSSLDRADSKADYIEQETDIGSTYDPYNPEMMLEAFGEIPEKIQLADFELFLLAYKKGDFARACNVIFDLVHGYCISRAAHDFENPDFD